MKKKNILTILLVIILIEIILRLGFSRELDFVGTPPVYQPDRLINYVYKPHSKFTRKGKDVYINNQGFIGKDFSVCDTNFYRIAIVGSSLVSGPNHLLEYHSFPPIVEKKFQENSYKVEVLNCGVDGGERSLQLLKSISIQVLDFKPDLILFEWDLPLGNSNISREAYRGVNIMYPFDNIESKEDVKKQVDGFLKYRDLIHIIHRSYIARVAIKYYMKQNFQNFTTYYVRAYQSNCWHSWGNESKTVEMDQSIRLISKVNNELQSRNIKFYLFQYSNDSTICEVATKEGLPLISLNINFITEDFYYKDGHFAESGCEKIADHIYLYLKKHNMIADKFNKN